MRGVAPSGPLRLRVGLALIVLSLLLWVGLAIVPFVGGAAARAVAAGSLVVAAEVTFWLGLALAGKPTWRAVKACGWRRAPRELAAIFVHGARPAASPAVAAPQTK
jgi:hypothetical protein